ncbi:MAG: DJ-1/PfpI family protein [Candidatus Puniceispirillales bacterium]
MPSSLSGKTIALVVCSGFDEQPFVTLQRSLSEAGASVKIVSRDNGVTNGWSGETWGLSYPVDAALAETLAVDYDGVVIPDGDRHTTLLLNDAHGKRVINAFLREDAPALVIGSAVSMIAELGYGPGDAGDAITRTGPLVTAPANADLNEMIDIFDAAMRNGANEDQAA